jgi:phytoene dehydrogenase-like protein
MSKSADADVIIIGGGHNGLACAASLCKSGLRTLVVECNEWLGGATGTHEVTLPGFRHDRFGSSHVWLHANPWFREFLPELGEHGLEYLWAEDQITGHPTLNGPGIVVYKDVDKTCDSIAAYSGADARRYREIYAGFVEIKDGFIKGMFSPPAPPSFLPMVMQNSPAGLRMLRDYHLSARAFVEETFEHPEVRNVILGGRRRITSGASSWRAASISRPRTWLVSRGSGRRSARRWWRFPSRAAGTSSVLSSASIAGRRPGPPRCRQPSRAPFGPSSSLRPPPSIPLSGCDARKGCRSPTI